MTEKAIIKTNVTYMYMDEVINTVWEETERSQSRSSSATSLLSVSESKPNILPLSVIYRIKLEKQGITSHITCLLVVSPSDNPSARNKLRQIETIQTIIWWTPLTIYSITHKKNTKLEWLLKAFNQMLFYFIHKWGTNSCKKKKKIKGKYFFY